MRTLFGTPGYVRGPRIPLYDVTPDGQQFIMVTRLGPRGWVQGETVYSRNWYWSAEVRTKLKD